MTLELKTNSYNCSRCGNHGYARELYAKVKNIDVNTAYKELLERECNSPNKSRFNISPINIISDIEIRDRVYRDFLSMLKLERNHRKYLENLGLLHSTIENSLYRSVPKGKIRRRLIAYSLSEKYNLAGTPGFYQDDDFGWTLGGGKGFYVPVYDINGYIQGLSIHLDTPFNNTSDIWFSSNNKINGTTAQNWVMKFNIGQDTNHIIIIDSLILGNLIKEVSNLPIIAFQNIANSYTILKEVEKEKIKNITFVFMKDIENERIQKIINQVYCDLIPLGYNLNIKYIKNLKDFFDEDFNVVYTLNKVG